MTTHLLSILHGHAHPDDGVDCQDEAPPPGGREEEEDDDASSPCTLHVDGVPAVMDGLDALSSLSLSQCSVSLGTLVCVVAKMMVVCLVVVMSS